VGAKGEGNGPKDTNTRKLEGGRPVRVENGGGPIRRKEKGRKGRTFAGGGGRGGKKGQGPKGKLQKKEGIHLEKGTWWEGEHHIGDRENPGGRTLWREKPTL